MVKLPEGSADRIPGVAGGGSGLGPAPSVEDLCKNMKRAEATHSVIGISSGIGECRDLGRY